MQDSNFKLIDLEDLIKITTLAKELGLDLTQVLIVLMEITGERDISKLPKARLDWFINNLYGYSARKH